MRNLIPGAAVALAFAGACSLLNTGEEYVDGASSASAGGGSVGGGGTGAGGQGGDGAGGAGSPVVARVFAVGGRRDIPRDIPDLDSVMPDVIFADLHADGLLGPWASAVPLYSGGNLNARVIGDELVVFGRFELIGGFDLPVLQWATLTPDGVAPWQVAWDTTSVGKNAATAILSDRGGYLIGGYTTIDSMTTYRDDTSVNFFDLEAGALSPLEPGPTLAVARRSAGVREVGGHVYAVGGYGLSPTFKATVEVATIQADGSLGPFTQLDDLPGVLGAEGVEFPCVASDGAFLYVLGGRLGSGPGSDRVVGAQILADGALGAYFEATELPGSLAAPSCFVFGGRLYAVGGEEPTGRTDDVLSIAINPDGTLGESWDLSSNPKLPFPRSEASIAVVPMP